MALASPAFVPVQTRSERLASTSVTDFPAVTGLEFEWKFIPLARVKHLTEGALDGSPTAFTYSESAGTAVDWIDPEQRGDRFVGRADVGGPAIHVAAFACPEFLHRILGEHGRTAAVGVDNFDEFSAGCGV